MAKLDKKLLLAAALFLLSAPIFAGDHSSVSFAAAADAFQKGDLVSAEATLTEILHAQPRDAKALGLLAVVLDTEKKYSEADSIYRRALALTPGSAPLLNNFGNHELATGDTIAARKTFLKVVALRPDHPNANLQLAAIAADQKNGSEALRYLERLRTSEPSPPQLNLLRMRALYLCGREEEANRLLLEFSSSAAHDAQLTFSAGLALASVAKYQQAEDFFSRTLESEPGNFDVLYNLGLAAFHAGHRQRAHDVLQAALAEQPQNVDTLYNLAVVNIDLKRSADALPLLGQAAHLEPARRDVQLTLAQTLSALGYYADAVTAYESYLKLAPTDDTARREHAFMLAVSGRKDLGLPRLETFLYVHPRDATAHYEIAVVESADDPTDAAAQLEKALVLQPDFAPARFARGTLHCQKGEFAAALPDLEFAAAQYPDNALVLDRLGKIYIDLDRFADAERVLNKAVEISPKNATVLLHLSRAYMGAGHKDEARTALERFRALGPSHADHVPPPGMADLLSLPPEELYAQYRAEVESRFKKEPDNPEVNVRYLQLLVDEGQTKEAADVALQLQSLHPPPLLAAEAAQALLRAAQYAEAKPLLQYAAASAPTIEVQLDLAIALFHTDGVQSAMTQLERVPDKQRLGDYYLARAQVLDAEGKPDEALADLQHALGAAPTRADLYAEAAHFLIRTRRPAEAIRLLDQASRALPDNSEILLLQAALFAVGQRSGDAERILQQIENRWPEWPATYVTYGILLEGQKRSDEAKAQLETALALGATCPQVYFYLAKSTLSATPDRLDEAAKEIGEALASADSDPDPNPETRALIEALAGRIDYDKQDYKGALEHLHVAIRLRPQNLQARYTLAQTYRALGQPDDAAREAEQAQRLREENPKADDDSFDIEQALPTQRP
ncbi:MAG: tetratricopeptide repeat protein [Terriglobales bacterium]